MLQIDGKVEGLEQDFIKLRSEIDAAMQITMNAMLSETETALRDSIQRNVYDGFTPTDYERRKEDYGLIDFNESHGVVSRDFTKDSFTLGYYPQGWSPQADPDWILDGDELIERIETARPPYDWNGDVPEPRPFLTPLMHELIEGGKYEDWFVKNMNLANPRLEVRQERTVIRDTDDWK